MRVFSAFVAAAMLFSGGVLSAQEPKTPTNRDNEKSTEAHATKADQEIAAVKLAECRNELELAKLAQQKSQNEQVKQFAARMIKDHGEACTKLEKWAGDYAKVDRTNRDRTTPPATTTEKPREGAASIAVQTGRDGVNIDLQGAKGGAALNWVAIHQQLADRCLASAKQELSHKEGAEFDKCYIGMQIMAHQKMVDADHVFATYVSADNRQHIEECAKTASDHLSSAKEIMEKLAGTSPTRSASRE